MSDNSTSIVPKLTNYPDRMVKAQSIVDWLVSVEAGLGKLEFTRLCAV